ncbi:MAG TPA: CDP-diacylglycerol diphosphatase [Steroidobacteraceae bacterium]|jgi:CDP-diacylglycerol pyrophosphatase|nr:CDP-diacylglycerol diphosphatase [Steroidobacteraceae bacterium]
MHRPTHAGARTASLLLAAAIGLCASNDGTAKSKDLPPAAGRDAYRQIVQDQCVIHWTEHEDPAPCEKVVFPAGPSSGASGYAVLADPDGGAHYLLIPTQTMTGTDASELLDPNLPNYFAEAWRTRALLSTFVGHAVPRTDVALVVGTAATRRQDQFHIHIECLRPDVVDSLKTAADKVTDRWSSMTVAGFPFQAMKLAAQGLETTNPFELVAASSPDARHHMGSYTVVVAGMQYASGPGFILLTGTGPSGDLLLDSGCIVAGGGS